MVKRVEGVYEEAQEALRAVDRLREQGYSPDDITIITNKEVRETFTSSVEANVTTQENDTSGSNEDSQTFWESVKDAFSSSDSYDDSDVNDPNYDAENDPVYEYREAINQGHIAVLVAGGPDLNNATAQTTATSRDGKDEQSIQLEEERLKVDKEKEKTGEVHVSKKVVEDTETVEVPVTKEEVTIERKPATDGKSREGEIDSTDEEEIVIPVEEEKVKPKKETDVVEEVEVKKETKQDSQTVGDTVRREELEVEEDGEALDSHDKNVDNPKDDTLDKEISNDRFGDDSRNNR